MSAIIKLITVFLIALPTLILAGGAPPQNLTPKANHSRPNSPQPELFRVKIHNAASGNISMSTDYGRSWRNVGTVLHPINNTLRQIYDTEFTASDWAPIGSVAATAVNALHIKADQSTKHARLFSILPQELSENIPTHSYWDESSSIFTNIPAGTKIFGAYAPQVGDEVFLQDDDFLAPWPKGRTVQLDDKIIIVVKIPAEELDYIELENRHNGEIIMVQNGKETRIGEVIRALGGTGRFGGTKYQEPSRIRANHPGVVCISTSPLGEIGGFQIIPINHANSATLEYIFTTSAYLVVGPTDDEAPALEGQAPLFNNLFKPGYKVTAKIGDAWQPLPTISGRTNASLIGVEALRLYSDF